MLRCWAVVGSNSNHSFLLYWTFWTACSTYFQLFLSPSLSSSPLSPSPSPRECEFEGCAQTPLFRQRLYQIFCYFMRKNPFLLSKEGHGEISQDCKLCILFFDVVLTSTVIRVISGSDIHVNTCFYTFEKRYVFSPHHSVCLSVCVCVCLCVCHQDCDEMAGLCNTVLSEAITPDNSSTPQHYEDDPLTGSGSYGSFVQNHILTYNFKTYKRIHTKFYLYVVQLEVNHIFCRFWDP